MYVTVDVSAASVWGMSKHQVHYHCLSSRFGMSINLTFLTRYVLKEKVLEVEIEPGMKDGYQYPFVAEGMYFNDELVLMCQLFQPLILMIRWTSHRWWTWRPYAHHQTKEVSFNVLCDLPTSPLSLYRHSLFERRGDDLYTNLTISLRDALVGFETEITHLDGHSVCNSVCQLCRSHRCNLCYISIPCI